MGSMKHILLVDDEGIIILNIARKIESEGYRVTLALDGKEGLQVFRDDPADLVITDLSMPVMDGYTFIRELRQEAPAVNIAVLSAAIKEELKEILVENHVCFTFSKPVQENMLVDAIHEVLN
jgi:CheY-like chemotaxis protein